MKWGITTLALLVFIGAAQAEPLDDDLQRALAHSPELRMAEARVAYAEAQLHAAKRGWFKPQLSVYGGESAITGTMRAGVAVHQDLDRLLTLNGAEVRQAQHELTLAQQDLTRTRESVVRKVHDASSALELARATLAVKQFTVPDTRKTLALIHEQFQAGTVTLDQLLTAQHTLAQAETELLQAHAALRTAGVAWAQLLGEPLPDEETSP